MLRPVKRVLITGAAGFIGCHLARTLTANDDLELILVDNLQRGSFDADFKRLLECQYVRFIELDLTDPMEWTRLTRGHGGFQRFDDVYHLAAVNGTKRFYSAPHEVLRTNMLTLINALDWVAGLSHRPRFMFTSSNEAYAGALAAFHQLPIPTPENVPLVIEDPRNPRWSYAGTKLLGEQFVIHYASHHKIPSVIVRPHNFYGPRAGHDHVIPEMIARIGRREDPFAIYGASETRSFCYIEDAVQAMISAMECAALETPTFHIGAATETTIGELAEHLFAIAHWRPGTLSFRPSPAGSVARRLPDVSAIHRETGWHATMPLLDGLRATYAWYHANHRGMP